MKLTVALLTSGDCELAVLRAQPADSGWFEELELELLLLLLLAEFLLGRQLSSCKADGCCCCCLVVLELIARAGIGRGSLGGDCN